MLIKVHLLNSFLTVSRHIPEMKRKHLSSRFFYKKQTFCFQPGCFIIVCQFQPQIFLKCFLKFLKLVITTKIDDNLMQLEGLTNYHFPPVSALDPTSHTQGDQELDDDSPQIVGDEPIKMI